MRKSLHSFLLLFFLLLISGKLTSQTYYFKTYGVVEGLAQNKVYAVEQDSSGYLWIGTGAGISRFDGYTFQNFSSDDSIADNGVRSLTIDSKQRIWFGHLGGGISVYDGEFHEVKFDNTFMTGDISSVTEDPLGQLWFTSDKDGAVVLPQQNFKDYQNVKIRQYRSQQGLSDRVFNSYVDKEGGLYFITDVGIKSYLPQDDKFGSYLLEGLPKFFQMTFMHQADNGDIWIGTYNGGVYRYLKSEKRFEIYDVRDGLAHNWTSYIFEDSRGTIWVGSWGGGITRFESSQISITEILNENVGLEDQKIRWITEDREGNILIGTNDHGLTLFKGKKFITYLEQDGLVNKNVNSILEYENEMWFGTNEGISVTIDGKIKRRFGDSQGLYVEQIRSLKKDSNGNVWVGTVGGGLFRYRNSRFQPEQAVNSYLFYSGNNVTCMEVDRDGDLWVGSIDGLLLYETKKGMANRLTTVEGLTGNDISSLYCDSRNRIWAGALGKGLAVFEDSVFHEVVLPKNGLTPVCFVEDVDGNIWVGTQGHGVYVLKNKEVTAHYTTKEGLLSDFITLLNVDENNNLYVGSTNGLNKVLADRSNIFSYSREDGFIGIETKPNATYISQDKKLWFGTVNGATIYNPKEDISNVLEPVTHITGFKVNLKDREMLSELELNYDEKTIGFDYSSICITNPTAVRYMIKMEGLDEDWGAPTAQTFVSYSHLPPGSYSFMVKASNNTGVWNKTPVSYSFTINPPFWKTWWFYTICVVILVVSIVVFIKAREKKLVREKRILEHKVEERTAEIVEMNQELEEKNKDITDSIRYAERIQRAILPPDEMVAEHLPNTFVYFRPKDIVSGDFYWLAKEGNKVLFAAVDCTGHGVPGAFMSIVGHNHLDKIVSELKLTQPSEILNELNKAVTVTLRQRKEEGDVKDGMDMALVCFDYETQKLEYAGAYNPMYLIVDGELNEIKANKFPIGSFVSEEDKQFTNHEFQLKKGDTIYVFSDGFADQFGGPKGKKFKYKQFKDVLLSIQDKEMAEQREYLDKVIKDWMAESDQEQIDDIIIIGSRL